MPRLVPRGCRSYAAARCAAFHGPHGSSFQEVSSRSQGGGVYVSGTASTFTNCYIYSNACILSSPSRCFRAEVGDRLRFPRRRPKWARVLELVLARGFTQDSALGSIYGLVDEASSGGHARRPRT